MNFFILENKDLDKIPAAQDQVGKKVNAGIMDAVAGMCEQAGDNIEVWYRGYNSQYPNLGVPNGNGIWLSDSIEYAKEYAEHFGEYGKIAKVYVDFSKVNYATEGDLYDNELDAYYSDADTVRIVKDMGYNAWLCDYYNDNAQGLCLVDSTPIVKTEILSDEEYNQVEALNEDVEANGTITLYHGVNRKGLEYNLEHGGFMKRVCAEGGPCAVWLSESQYNYEFTFQFTFPKTILKNKLTKLSNVDYVYEDDISFDEFDCKLVKTKIILHNFHGLFVELNLFDNELLSRQLKTLPDLPEALAKEFENYTMISEYILKDFIQKNVKEGAEPESDTYNIGFEGDSNNEYAHVINESTCDNEMKKYIDSLLDFMRDEGLNIYPYPKIKLDDSEQDGLFIRTGYYEPSTKTVVVFTRDRHVKDCMRSLAHELIHHEQNLDGKNLSFTSNDDVKDNKRLEKIESEAYLKGNIYFRKWTEYQQHGDKKTLNESIEANKVDLSSFTIKRNLNPKFWKNDRLDSRVRMKLLDLADDFLDFLGVDWVKPDDIIMTGSLANFNWHQKYSDIDLHILMDYSKVDKRKEFVSNYFYSQKKLWNEEHKDLKIYGFPVEVYVQDTNEKSLSSGVYSLEKDKWIEEPEREALANSKVNKTFIKDKVAEYANKIDELNDKFKEAKGDNHKLEDISKEADKIFNEIISLRKKSLEKAETEISNGNIIFKCLRRFGFIEKLSNLKSNSYDKINSIK